MTAWLQVKPEVRRLILPVLSTRWDDSESGTIKTEQLLDKVLMDNTEAGNEASAILLGYYLGVHNGEEQIINITQRGNRVLPYLLKYRNDPPLPLRPDFWLFRLGRSEREGTYDQAIDLVRQGKILED